MTIGTSTFSQVLPGAITKSYIATAAYEANTIATAPDSSGEVTTATSGAGFGVFANSGDAGTRAQVVTFGPALLKFGGTVAQGGGVVATTGGEGLAAAAGVACRIRLSADAKQLNQVIDGDIAEVLVGVGSLADA